MSTLLYGYIDRDNIEKLALLQDGVAVTAGAVTKAVLKFGDYCINTDDDSDQIYFLDSDNQTVCIKIGQIDSISVGRYKGTLTIYDSTAVNGLAWVEVEANVYAWDVCPA
jgi:hypothetical protein